MCDKAAVVVARSMFVARGFLEREGRAPPPNIRLYDLLAQAEAVEADKNLQCVRRIKVLGKDGPVELSAVIFDRGSIIPGRASGPKRRN